MVRNVPAADIQHILNTNPPYHTLIYNAGLGMLVSTVPHTLLKNGVFVDFSKGLATFLIKYAKQISGLSGLDERITDEI